MAVNTCDVLGPTTTGLGATETDIGNELMVTVNVADLVGSATAVAVTVAVAELATLAGASYSTDVLV